MSKAHVEIQQQRQTTRKRVWYRASLTPGCKHKINTQLLHFPTVRTWTAA